MSRNNISISIENSEEIIEVLGATEAQMKKAVKRTVSDLKQRVPGWISEKVMEEYNIKKKDIMEALKIKSRATTVEISGVKVDSLDFVFKGRPLTPIHFKMKPGRPYKNNRKYKGQLTYTYLALYGFLRTFIEGLRTDSLMVNNFRISQVLSIILCVVFSTVLVYKKVKKDKKYEK